MTAVTIHLGQPATDAWRHDAACAGRDPELWHPASYDSTVGKVLTDVAISICRQCPAMIPCLVEAMEREGHVAADSRHGTWGGATPEDRARLAGARRLSKRRSAE